MPEPAISIVIPSWTGEVSGVMQGIERQTFQDYEVLTISGVSPAARARNVGARRARADILVFIDDDARLGSEGVLAMLYELLTRDPSLGIVGTSKILPPTASPLQRAMARQVPRMVHPVVGQAVETNPPLNAYGFSAVTTTCCAMRRSVFEEVNGFDESLPTGPEDTDFFYRIHSRGHRIVLAADCWVYHEPPTNIASLLRKSFRYGVGHAWEARKSPERAMKVLPLDRWYGRLIPLATLVGLPFLFFVHYYFDPVRRIEFGFKPLKTLSTSAVLVGYIYGWNRYSRPRPRDRTYLGRKPARTTPHNVLYVDAYPKTGGGQQVLLSIVNGLPRDVFHPVVALPAESPFRNLLSRAGVESIGVKFRPENYTLPRFRRPVSAVRTLLCMARTIRQLASIARRQEIDLIHANSAVAGVHAIPVAMLLGVPCVVHAHDFQTSDKTNALLKLLLRYKQSTVVFVSNSLADHYKLGSGYAGRGRTIYNGVDVARFRPNSAARRALIERYQLPVGAFIVGSVGRIEPRKGLLQVVESLAPVARRFPHVRLLAVGDFPEHAQAFKERLTRRISELGLQDNIVFTGFLEDMPALVAGLDVLVSCATGEGGEAFPLNVLEAMACGRPVITVPQGGVVEQVVDGENGRIVPSGDTDATTAALMDLMRDPDLGQRMGDAGRRRVQEQFTIAQQVNAMQRLYAECLTPDRQIAS